MVPESRSVEESDADVAQQSRFSAPRDRSRVVLVANRVEPRDRRRRLRRVEVEDRDVALRRQRDDGARTRRPHCAEPLAASAHRAVPAIAGIVTVSGGEREEAPPIDDGLRVAAWRSLTGAYATRRPVDPAAFVTTAVTPAAATGSATRPGLSATRSNVRTSPTLPPEASRIPDGRRDGIAARLLEITDPFFADRFSIPQRDLFRPPRSRDRNGKRAAAPRAIRSL